MKKVFKLNLLVLLITLIGPSSCKKDDIRNIRPNGRYELMWAIGPNAADFKEGLFPGGLRVIFTFDRDKKTATFRTENNDYDPCSCYWRDSYDNWYYDSPKYEYTAEATFDDNNNHLEMNFNVPAQYQNSYIGHILKTMSGTYTGFRTNGFAIGPNEVVEVTSPDVKFKIAKLKQ